MKDMAVDLLPHNIEAEQAVLGAIMLDNELYHLVSDILTADHFYDPVHALIWRTTAARINRDHAVTPVTLKSDLENDDGLKELGGAQYLARLAGSALNPGQIRSYALLLVEAWQGRALVQAVRAASDALLGPSGVEIAKGHLEAVLSALPTAEGKASSVSILSAVTSAVEEMNAAYQGEGGGLSSGIRDFDEMTGGLWPGDLVILGGRPSMGKTAVATSIAYRVAKAGTPVALVSLEMTEASIAGRMISELSGIAYADARRGKMSEAEFRKVVEKAQTMGDLPISIIPQHVRDVMGVYGALRREHARYRNMAGFKGLGLVIVDYLQLLRAKGTGRYEQMTEVSLALKSIAMTLKVPVIALAQLSREVEKRENKRPVLSDLKESGQIEQDADAVVFCYRDHYYLTREEPPKKLDERADWEAALTASKSVMELIIAKQRMGPIGTVKIGCHLPTNKIWDLGARAEGEDFR